MSFDVGKEAEGLKNELWRRWSDVRFEEWGSASYVTAHSTEHPLLHLRNRHFTYVTWWVAHAHMMMFNISMMICNQQWLRHAGLYERCKLALEFKRLKTPCTSGTSRVLKVVSLQRLKMEALISAPADCEVWFMIWFLNSQSIASIKMHRQLCQVYGHILLGGQHISCRSSAEKCLIIIHHISRISRPVISIFFYTSRNSWPVRVSVLKMTERRRWEW